VLKPESWAVLATAALGIAAAIVAFLRTPREQRFRVRAPTVEQRLAAAPPQSRAVIIRADRRRAFRRDLPWLIAALPLAAFALWFEDTRSDACATLFGVGRLRLVVWALIALPPLLVVSASVQTIRQVRSILRGGHWPPLDSAVYVDTLATSGPWVRLRAIGLLVLLVAALAMIAFGYWQAAAFASDGSLWQRISAFEAACVGHR